MIGNTFEWINKCHELGLRVTSFGFPFLRGTPPLPPAATLVPICTLELLILPSLHVLSFTLPFPGMKFLWRKL